MIYEKFSEEFIRFLKSPYHNQHLIYRLSFQLTNKPASKITTLFKQFVDFRSPKNLFEADLKANLILAKKDLFNSVPSNNSCSNSTKELLNEFKDYFTVGVYFDSKNELNDYGENFTKKIIAYEQLQKFKYVLSQLFFEGLQHQIMVQQLVKNDKLFIGVLCSELLYFIQIGLYKIKLTENEYKIYPAKKYKDVLNSYWFTVIMEKKIQLSLDNDFQVISQYLTSYMSRSKTKSAISRVIKSITRYLFSISIDNINLKMLTDDVYIDVLIFVILIESLSLSADTYISKDELLNSRLIDSQQLLSYIEYIKKHQASSSYMGFVYYENNQFSRGMNEFKTSSRSFIADYVNQTSLIEKQKKSVINQNNITSNSIFNFFKSLHKSNYKLISGFDFISIENNKKSKIKLIINDVNHNIFYFIMVDISVCKLPNTLVSKIEFVKNIGYNKNNFTEIYDFKQNFFYYKKKYFSTSNLSKATLENSKLLVFHNMPFLNGYQKDNIDFYEWRLFHYMIQGGCGEVSEENDVKENSIKNNCKIFDFDNITKCYLKNCYQGRLVKKELGVYENAFAFFKLGKRSVIAKIL